MKSIAIVLLLAVQPAGVHFADDAERAGLGFVLQHHPTAEEHQVEAMPGGVAAFDFDNYCYDDLYFL